MYLKLLCCLKFIRIQEILSSNYWIFFDHVLSVCRKSNQTIKII
uniref:Uncharacterized protein n=1 Tax=Rhizophora mucronata TaxID=61149 RepID=A0A2P2PN80_RHIMU